MSTPDLTHWLPISISKHTAEPIVEWCRFDTQRFTAPFFDHTVQEALRDPFNLLYRQQTSLDTLCEVQAQRPGLAPGGFIFHMSRCGSTLVSQMLAALPEHIVLSEPPPLDSILRTDLRGASDEQRIKWLRAWMHAISLPGSGEQRLFVKLDAWHALDLPILRRAFPDTPWIFLYRDPVEVMVSAMKAPGMHLVPNLIDMNIARIAPEDAQQMTREQYAVHILAMVLRSALNQLGPQGGQALDYRSLPESVITHIAPHFGLTLTAEQIEAMNAKTAFHAKTPQLFFEPDSQSKQAEASTEIRALCAEHLDPLYRLLQQQQ